MLGNPEWGAMFVHNPPGGPINFADCGNDMFEKIYNKHINKLFFIIFSSFLCIITVYFH